MLKRITFTGIDDTTDLGRVLDISRRFPIVEWGVLVPMKGRGRWPSEGTVMKLLGAAALAPYRVQLAGHLCEPHIGPLLAGQLRLRDVIGEAFPRVQINTHGKLYRRVDGWTDGLASDHPREYILQLDDETAPLLISDFYDGRYLASGLHDLSHGAGLLPASWPARQEGVLWTGYAGGLGPHNLAEQLPKIAAAAGDHDYWIDMETHVRTDDRLDLDKVERCLGIALQPVEA